jgi:PAS domain S-box-containing protein
MIMTVERELEAVRQALVALGDRVRSAPDQSTLPLDLLDQLAQALDDLQAFADDLRVQNEELLGHREVLETERQRYLQLFEFAPDGFLVTDIHGVIREANRAAGSLLRMDRDFLVGKPVALFVRPGSQSAFRQHLARLQTQDEVQGWEVPLDLRTGKRIHAAMDVTVLRSAWAVPTLYWTIRDISERKRLEARFRAAVEAAPAAMMMIDSAGSIVLVNTETERLFGYARQELLGRGVEVLVPERFRGEHPRLRSQFFASPEARRMGAGRDLFGLRKDGSEFPVEIGLNPIETEEGLFVLAAILEITERKRNEDALRRQMHWDEALKTIGQAATSLLPLTGILTGGAEAICRASGATLAVVRLVDPKTKDLVVAAHRGVPAEYLAVGERIPWGREVAGTVAASGQPRAVGRPEEQPGVSELSLLAGRAQSLACLPLKAGSQVVGTLTLGHDQAEYFSPTDLEVCRPAASMLAGAILAERLRVATMKEAEEKALLFQELDHRVRNHLAALISLLHLGAEGSEGTAAERLREMAERVARVGEVHNLLTGRGMQPIEVRELAEGIAKNVLLALPGNLTIEWAVSGDTVRVPPSQVTAIALILNELLTNCTKHAFPGRATGTVTIRVAHEDNQIDLEVQDDGVGLDPAKHPADLGMTIVQTIVTQTLRGTVRFAAEGGTQVTIRFPHVEETPEGDSP